MSDTRTTPPVELSLGALSPRLEEQLRKQGKWVEAAKLDHYQRDADAISRLRVRGLLPDRAAYAARSKLINNLLKEMT
jgi:hypothetical protein